jgi:hypothetical protein
MASVNDYLKKLLYQYDCIVVPELGAFLTHYQPASFTESSGLYLPPRKRVAFNEALRLDDGILANYIMLHEPVTREGAQRYISRFAADLRQQVTVSGRFELEGIGTFTHNEEGKLQFEPGLRHNFFGEAFGMSAVSAQSLTTQAVDAVVVEPAPTAVGPVRVENEETTLMPLPRSRPYWRVAAAALLVGSLGLVSYFSVIKPGQPQQSSLDPGALFRVPSALYEKSTDAPGPIPDKPAASLSQTSLVKPAPVAPLPKPVVAAVVTLKPLATRIPVVTTVARSSAPVRSHLLTGVRVAKPARTTPYFTVIAGSFSRKRNAVRLKHQLQKAGYTDAFVLVPSRRGQLYKVAAVGSANRQEAISSIDAINTIAGTQAWIYKN